MVNIVEIVVRTVNDTKAGLESAKKDFAKAGQDIAGALKPVGIAMAGSGLLSMAAPLGAAGVAVGAFGAIAAPTLSKVEKALTTTGKAGKQAWANLDPAQRNLAMSIKGLQGSFNAVAKSLEPMVTGVLHLGVTLAHDLLPALSILGRAGGAALTSILTPLDKLVKSSGFTKFIQQMATFAKQAAPIIGTLLVGAIQLLMQMMEQLAPVGIKLLQALTPLLLGVMKSAIPVVKTLATVLSDILTPLSKFSGVVGPLVIGFYGLVKVVQLARGVMLALTAAMELNPVILITTAIIALGVGVHLAWEKFSTFRDILKDIAKVMLQVGIIIVEVNRQIVNAILTVIGTILHGLKDAFGWIPGGVGSSLKAASAAFDRFHSGVNNTLDGIINKMHGWDNALDASKNKASTATQIIQGDFGKQLIATNASTKGVNTLASAIGNLHGKTVTVGANATASGTISITGSGWAAGQGNIRFHAAQGAYINSGSGPTADDNLARVSRGELIVPAHMVSAGAVNNLRGKIPGFAAGGIIGGMPQAAGAFAGTDAKRAVTAGVAEAIATARAEVLKAVEASISSAGSTTVSGSGPVGGDSGANRALARKMFPWSASQWPSFDTLEMHEAGYNRFARNSSSGAYGIPQALPPTKMPFAAQQAGGSHAGPQLSWMFAYIKQRYGTPGNAWAKYYQHPGGVGWYDNGGWLPTGASIAVNNTGKPERILGPHDSQNITLTIEGGESAFEQFMLKWLREHVRVKGGGNVQRAFGIGGR